MDKVESLLAYIEQRAEELSEGELDAFIVTEGLWMKGYIRALMDYNVKTSKETMNSLITLADIVKKVRCSHD